MKTFTGKTQIGKLKNVSLIMDWDYLRKSYGMRRESEMLDNAIGKLLVTISGVTVFVVTVLYIVQGSNPLTQIWQIKSLEEILFWAGYVLFFYAFFLMRDRARYSDTLKTQTLDKVRRKAEEGSLTEDVNLTEYISNDMLNVLDDLLKTDGHYFLENLTKKLLEFKTVQSAIPRLGIKPEVFTRFTETIGMELNSHVDEWLLPILLNAFIISLHNSFEKIDELAVFVYLCKIPFRTLLLKQGVTERETTALEMWIKNVSDTKRFQKMYRIKSALKPVSTVNRAFTSRYSPTLIAFSRDFTKEVVSEKFEYCIGREKELAKLIEVIESGDKSAVLIIGAPGVGKTTFLKSLAIRMVVEDVPDVLKDKRLVGFDFTRAFAHSINIEVFKRRLENVMEEVEAAKNIVLVIDDLYQLVNIRPEYASEVIGILTKTLDESKIRLICTSTPEGFSRYIKPQQALISMFDVIDYPEPSDEVALQVLLDELPEIEAKYKVKVEFDAIQNAIKLSHKYNFERVLPDKAIDLMEEACVRAVNEKLNFVSKKQVDELVSEKVGVNIGVVGSDEAASLMNIEERIQSRVIGQVEAVQAVASAMRRSRTGLVSQKRPVSSFLFFGPTGVGKTELAKAVATAYYGKEDLMIRIDMSEYQEEENIARLIGREGSNSFEGGYLTEAVRQRPFSLILLDEIEKANPKVLDLFLQILDEGEVTDGMGRKISFRNTIIIATSNVASKEIADDVAKGLRYQEILEDVLPKLRQFLRVEFINRFDKVVMFKPLTKIDILKITSLMLDKVRARLSENGMQLVYSEKLVEEIAKLGYNQMYGARELNRAIQDNVEDRIAKIILERSLKSGNTIVIESLDEITYK